MPLQPLEKLIRSVHRSVTLLARSEIEALGLTLPRIWVLNLIRTYPGLTMSELAKKLGLSKSTVTHLTDELVKSALVRRYSDEMDRRVLRLQLSPTGMQKLDEALAIRQRVLEEAIRDPTPLEISGIVAGLEMLEARLHRMLESKTSPTSK